MSDVPASERREVIAPVDGPDLRIARLRERHWSVLLVSITVIAAALCLEVNDRQRVSVAGWPSWPVPELCASRTWFGVNCPGCGLTRSFIHLAHGRVAASFAIHHIGWILALVVLAQIPYRLAALCSTRVGGLDSRWPRWLGRVLVTLLIGNWVVTQLVEF